MKCGKMNMNKMKTMIDFIQVSTKLSHLQHMLDTGLGQLKYRTGRRYCNLIQTIIMFETTRLQVV